MKGFTEKVAPDVVKDAQQGQLLALKQLYQDYGTAVLRLVSGILGSVEEGRDLTQEIFIKVFGKLPELRQIDAFPSWLKQLSVRMAVDQLRKRVGFVHEALEEVIESEPDWMQATDRLCQLDDIERVMSHLSEVERALVWLHVVEGYTHEELSKMLECSEAAVRQRYRRAMVKLKSKLYRQVKDEQ